MSHAEKLEANGPQALAFRMAGYIADPNYIASYVAREYGKHRAPTVEQCKAYRETHERRKAEFRRLSERCDLAERQRQEAAENREKMRRAARAAEQARIDAKRAEMAAADAQAAREALSGFMSLSNRIVAAVAFAFAMPVSYMTSPSRARRAVLARFVAIRLLRDQMDDKGRHRFSTPQIGRMVGRSDHSTVLHALHNFDKQMAASPSSLAIYTRLSSYLTERQMDKAA